MEDLKLKDKLRNIWANATSFEKKLPISATIMVVLIAYTLITFQTFGILTVIALFVSLALILINVFMIISMCLRVKLKNHSTYLTFLIVCITTALLLTLYGIYDLATSTGFLAGLMGTLVLCYVVPVPLVVLLIGTIVYLVNKKKNNDKVEQQETSEPSQENIEETTSTENQ